MTDKKVNNTSVEIPPEFGVQITDSRNSFDSITGTPTDNSTGTEVPNKPLHNKDNRDKVASEKSGIFWSAIFWLRNFWSGNFLLKHAILTFGLLATTVGGALFLQSFAEEQANKWTQGLKYAPNSQQKVNQLSSMDQSLINKLPNATFAEKTRLSNQLNDIRNRARNHISVARAFYIWNYQALSIAAVSSIVAAVSLLLLSRRGWDGSNKYIVNVFVVSFGITVVVQVFPALFKQEENISNSTRTYLAYIALDNRLSSYIATQEFTGFKSENISNPSQLVIGKDAGKNIKNVIRSVDDELASLHNIYIGFDATKIPNYRQVFNEVNQQN